MIEIDLKIISLQFVDKNCMEKSYLPMSEKLWHIFLWKVAQLSNSRWIPILNNHFQWWIRKGSADPGENSEAMENTKFEYPPAMHSGWVDVIIDL